jgi:hypothetical protein
MAATIVTNKEEIDQLGQATTKQARDIEALNDELKGVARKK